MSFTGIKSAGTILGSHEWQLDKLENFTITFWEKPTFNTFMFPWMNWTLQEEKSASFQTNQVERENHKPRPTSIQCSSIIFMHFLLFAKLGGWNCKVSRISWLPSKLIATIHEPFFVFVLPLAWQNTTLSQSFHLGHTQPTPPWTSMKVSGLIVSISKSCAVELWLFPIASIKSNFIPRVHV